VEEDDTIMAITYNEVTYDVVDNQDGTFTLTPQSDFTAALLIAEYRDLRQEGLRIVAYRDKLQAQYVDYGDRLTELITRRDELKTVLETAGENPDEDLE
jgi:hypothetical protein